MSNEMMLFQNKEFGEVRVIEKDGRILFVAKDIATVLGYSNPQKAVRDHCKKATPIGVNDSFTLDPQTVVIPESDVYRLVMRSKLPSAEGFETYVVEEILPTIRKTGEYATPEAKRRKADKKDELALRRIEVMEKNADYRMAKLILEGIDKFSKVMTPESMTVFMATYAELTTKQDMTHMLPQATEPMYSATDIGKECGVSAQMVGKTANEHGLKSPQGESGQFGTWIRSKSQHSDKEVMTFVYNDNGRNWFLRHFGVMATA